jgi:uncharacterized membrane-anchored protein YhcB (DUF1043 family)
MPPELYVLVGLAVGLAAGVVLGRRTNRVRAYARGLEQKLEEQRLVQERLAEGAQAAQDELKRRRQEAEAYRGQVSEHFGDTSRLLRELTLQYRAVYEHLAEGARDLCAEGSIPLDVGLPESPLLPGAESLELDEGDDSGAARERASES